MTTWQAECLDCAFKATRPTRKAAATAVEAHIRETHHERWLIVPVSDRANSAEDQTPKSKTP